MNILSNQIKVVRGKPTAKEIIDAIIEHQDEIRAALRPPTIATAEGKDDAENEISNKPQEGGDVS